MVDFDLEHCTLWLDDDLLAVNKPAGLLTLQHGYDPSQPFLVDLLQGACGPLWVVHRLDRDTSGVIVFARNPEAHRNLNTQFEQRRTTKTYHALVCGVPDWREARIDLTLRVNGDRKHRTIVDPRGGKPSSTKVRLLEGFSGYALVEAQPHSGRRHQIRAHLAAWGLPIVVDALYGNPEPLWRSHQKPGYEATRQPETPLLGRLGLHAWELQFAHPRGRQPVIIQAPYPEDFHRALTQLRQASSQVSAGCPQSS